MHRARDVDRIAAASRVSRVASVPQGNRSHQYCNSLPLVGS